ncbi:photosynthetic complex assembly protein PuhC [Roseomonas rosulenta]|uniref:photosynthetic complex assembly protein PuhC n=1 Tax=Roseomonas rosulenta TaxID=2748667 RepID=UPI0018DFD0BA|nr:photosynthetic complex assembly protein PuhC [Roseomonas rosulenta]
MHRTMRQEVFGKGPVLAMGLGILALVGLTIAPLPSARAPESSALVRSERSFVAADRGDGAVVLSDAATGREVLLVAPGEDGFLRGTLRGLARDRRLRDLGPQAPFRLVSWSDGRLTLDDTATGRRLDLLAFGQTQADAFARLLPIGEK